MIIPMLCVTIFVILVVWFLLPRVARLMIHTPTAISIFVCVSMVQLMADRKSGSAGMPRPISYAIFGLKKKKCIRLRRVTVYSPLDECTRVLRLGCISGHMWPSVVLLSRAVVR